MRYGFTTGSCATAAAKASLFMLLSGGRKEEITIITPKGISFTAQLCDIVREQTWVSCAVQKDGGDDPDITTGAMIQAKVWVEEGQTDTLSIHIDGGKGVGRVTKPGLDQPVGNAAINHVPREMIERELTEVARLFDFHGEIYVEVSVPTGEELAEKTFNPRLGIVGGISILGTSGIVEPMSSQALIETIRVESRQRKALGYEILAVSPGNYGLDFMKSLGYDLEQSVKCSNFIGDTIDIAAELGFTSLLLTGHIGKLVKVAGGIMNTHSKEGDCRMEILAAAAMRAKAEYAVCQEILEAVTTEEGIRILKDAGMVEPVMQLLIEKMKFFLEKRAAGRIQIELMVYANDYGLLGETEGARELLSQLKE